LRDYALKNRYVFTPNRIRLVNQVHPFPPERITPALVPSVESGFASSATPFGHCAGPLITRLVIMKLGSQVTGCHFGEMLRTDCGTQGPHDQEELRLSKQAFPFPEQAFPRFRGSENNAEVLEDVASLQPRCQEH
jgi:hypothetical protein